jgi:hypothetical protein
MGLCAGMRRWLEGQEEGFVVLGIGGGGESDVWTEEWWSL